MLLHSLVEFKIKIKILPIVKKTKVFDFRIF